MLNGDMVALDLDQCSWEVEENRETTARVVGWRHLAIANSSTLECSLAGSSKYPQQVCISIHLSSFYLIEQLIQKWGSATSCFIRQMFDYWNDMQMSFHHLPPHAVIDESIISIETLAQGNESEWISLCLRSCWRCIIQSAMTSHSPFDTDRCGEQFEFNWILLFRQNVFRKVCTLQWNRPFWRESVMESDCSGRPMASRALLYANFRPSRWIGSNFTQLSDSPLPWSFIDLSIFKKMNWNSTNEISLWAYLNAI